jgi:hypothetical protein
MLLSLLELELLLLELLLLLFVVCLLLLRAAASTWACRWWRVGVSSDQATAGSVRNSGCAAAIRAAGATACRSTAHRSTAHASAADAHLQRVLLLGCQVDVLHVLVVIQVALKHLTHLRGVPRATRAACGRVHET